MDEAVRGIDGVWPATGGVDRGGESGLLPAISSHPLPSGSSRAELSPANEALAPPSRSKLTSIASGFHSPSLGPTCCSFCSLASHGSPTGRSWEIPQMAHVRCSWAAPTSVSAVVHGLGSLIYRGTAIGAAKGSNGSESTL